MSRVRRADGHRAGASRRRYVHGGLAGRGGAAAPDHMPAKAPPVGEQESEGVGAKISALWNGKVAPKLKTSRIGDLSGGRHVQGSLQEGLLYGSEYGPTKRQVFIQRIVLLVQAAVVGIAVVGVSVDVGVHEADGMSSLCIGHWGPCIDACSKDCGGNCHKLYTHAAAARRTALSVASCNRARRRSGRRAASARGLAPAAAR